MRKPNSTASRIRKKATSGSSSSNNNDKSIYEDPVHNGSTPACRQLNNAILDVFPELQKQMMEEKQFPPSHLGTLLRWRFLSNRKARKVPPPPAASPGDGRKSPLPPGGASTKRKRKRKKKKKQDTGNNNNNNKNDNNADPANNNTINSPGFDERSVAELSVEILDEAIDRSLTEHETNMQQATAEAHSLLESLPSDDKNNEDPEYSTSVFFEQIQPQQSASNLKTKPEDLLPDDTAAMDASNHHHQTPEGASPQTPIQTKQLHTSAAVSAESAAAMVTPTRPSPPSTATTTTTDPNLINSPTHEWVPLEGAESKVETPPGEAIKNPLELPFLLTLTNSDAGVTTTSHTDGSLIYAEKTTVVVPEALSSFETTKTLFEDWLDQLDSNDNNNNSNTEVSSSPKQSQETMQRNYESFVDFLQTRLFGKAQSSGISFQFLKDSVAGIECSNCRKDAQAELDKLENNQQPPSQHHPTVVLDPSCLADPKPDDSIDEAFDYVALEEGHHLPNHLNTTTPTQDVEEYEMPVDKADNLCLILAADETKPKNKSNSSTKALYLESMTQTQLDKLVEVWLPCGIDEDIMVTTPIGLPSSDDARNAIILNHEEVANVQQHVLESENEARKTLADMQTTAKEMSDEVQNVVSSSQATTNLEFKTFPMLKTCDENCSRYIDLILDILQLCTSEQSHALANVQLHLWTCLLEALNQALDACDTYYSKVMEEMADQQGVVPKMFVSAPLRNLFQVLVEKKIQVWTKMGTTVMETLTNRVLKEWFTRFVWEQERIPKHQSGSSAALDDNCHELVGQLVKWTESILGGRVDKIQRERMVQTEHILELLQSTVEPLSKEYSTVERFFSKDRNNYFASLRSNIVLAQGVKKRMRLIDHNEVKCMATGVILMWRHVRIMQSRMISSLKIPALPLQLKRWMLQDEGQFDDWRHGFMSNTSNTNATEVPTSTTSLDPHQMYCRIGKGGKRRVACILAGLIYQWLERECKEWKAILLQQELLTDFDISSSGKGGGSLTANGSGDMGGFAANEQRSSKSSKKNKKKKNKNAAAAQAASQDAQSSPQKNGVKTDSLVVANGGDGETQTTEPKELLVAASGGDESKDDVIPALTENLDAATGSPEDASSSPTSRSMENGETKMIEENANPESSNGVMENDGNEQELDVPISLEEEVWNLDRLCHENVYIQDDKKKTQISARNFMIGRLETIMNDIHNKEDVVIIEP